MLLVSNAAYTQCYLFQTRLKTMRRSSRARRKRHSNNKRSHSSRQTIHFVGRMDRRRCTKKRWVMFTDRKQVLQFALDVLTVFTHWNTNYTINAVFKTLPGYPPKSLGSLINLKDWTKSTTPRVAKGWQAMWLVKVSKVLKGQ